MSRPNKSWLSRCLTPKVELPVRLVWSASALCWLLVFGLWALLSYGGVVPAMFLPSPVPIHRMNSGTKEVTGR